MYWIPGIAVILGGWSALYLIDFFLRSRNCQPYILWMETHAITISFFQIRWSITDADIFLSHGWIKRIRRRFLGRLWFGVGVLQTTTCLVFILVYLTKVLVDECVKMMGQYSLNIQSTGSITSPVTTKTSDEVLESQNGIVAVIPGVTLPWSELPLLVLSLTVAGVVHELGHALAAVNARVGVNSFGVFIMAIYPGAFTELDSQQLNTASVSHKLRIFCAGIWHNFVCAIIVIIIVTSLPWLLLPFYMTNNGVQVTRVSPLSGVSGPSGLRPGHVLRGMSQCVVHDKESWTVCLNSLPLSNFGNCMPRKDVYLSRSERVEQVLGEMQCCPHNLTNTHMCFYSKSMSNTSSSRGMDYSCLPARYVTDHPHCNASMACAPRAICVFPALFNSTKLLRLIVANTTKPVLFVGHPAELLHQVQVSNYVQLWAYIPVWIAELIELVCKYVITFSIALALLNAVPCFGLDGHFIIPSLIDFVGLRFKCVHKFKHCIVTVLLYYGTVVLVLNIALALKRMFVQ